MRRKLENRDVRKIFQSGSSNAVTLPAELLRELKWRKGQKVVVRKRGKGILILDWEK